MTGDRFWWREGLSYRDLAKRLRDIARRCPLPTPQQELLDLAQRYERRADDMDRSAALINAKFRPSLR
jgi:hypothetical protein